MRHKYLIHVIILNLQSECRKKIHVMFSVEWQVSVYKDGLCDWQVSFILLISLGKSVFIHMQTHCIFSCSGSILFMDPNSY